MTRIKAYLFTGLALIITLTLVLGGCGQAPAPTTTQPVEWKIGGLMAETFWLARAKIWWGDQIDKKTNGRLKMRYYPGAL